MSISEDLEEHDEFRRQAFEYAADQLRILAKYAQNDKAAHAYDQAAFMIEAAFLKKL